MAALKQSSPRSMKGGQYPPTSGELGADAGKLRFMGPARLGLKKRIRSVGRK